MERATKVVIAVLIGVLALGTVSLVSAQEETPETTEETEQDETMRPGRHRGKHAIRGEFVVPSRENEGGFVTVRTDRGELTAIDGNTLTITEADGEVVEVVVTEDTEIRREGEDATLDDLQVGDHVRALRTAEGDAELETRRVGAVSAERYAELEAERSERRAQIEACREDPDAEGCDELRLQRRGGPRRGGPRPGSGPRGPLTEDTAA